MIDRKQNLMHKYLRPKKKYPTVWCPGCGIGTVLGSMLRTIHSLGWDKDDIAVISGIGCTGRVPTYVDFNTLHTTHGRALTFATGLKLVKPNMKVIAIMGDGDALSIGGNHFIHSCRRNIDITAIVVNNYIYGMTGGQVAPTTPHATKATTAPYGNIDNSFDTVKLATGAGASFVARTTVYHVVELDRYMKKALTHKGFSVLEVLSNCHTYWGRFNKMKEPYEHRDWLKDNTVLNTASEDKKKGKILRGIFVQEQRAEYVEEYYKLIKSYKINLSSKELRKKISDEKIEKQRQERQKAMQDRIDKEKEKSKN